MVIRCPTCGCVLPMDDVNVARDLALCRGCERTYRFADLVAESRQPPFDPASPPPGAWFEETFDGFRVGATTRSLLAFFLVPFMLFWSGGSLGGIYGSQIAKGQFDLVPSLLGLPFLAGTIFLGGIAVMTVCGRVVVTVAGDEGEVFTGIGPFGYRRRFRWSGISRVEEGCGAYSGRRQPTRVIRLVGDRLLAFGSMLNEQRRYYLIQALRQMQTRSKMPIKPAGVLDLG